MKALTYKGLVIGCDQSLEIVPPNVLGTEQSFAGLDLEHVLIVDCEDARVVGHTYDAATGTFTPAPPQAPGTPPTVGAIAFQRLFTRRERVKARELRDSDRELDDIWRQLDDPRTDVVVIALPSVQDDIEYTLEAIKAGGLDIDVQARKAEILKGEIQ